MSSNKKYLFLFNFPLTLLLLFALNINCSHAFLPSQKNSPIKSLNDTDPFQWLEEIENEKSLNWVEEQNLISEHALLHNPIYKTLEPSIREIYYSKDRLSYPSYHNGYIYNFWQDEVHIRGLLRRTSLQEYSQKNPQWETFFDLDELEKKEKKNWVWKGSTCLPPNATRCLFQLSVGGKDAVVIREYDLNKKEFVSNGFELPEAKSEVAWLDLDHVYVATDFGQDSLTDSGYPRIIKIWTRGTPLSEAQEILSGDKKDVAVFPFSFHRPDGQWSVFLREISFFESEKWLISPINNKKFLIPIPESSSLLTVFKNELILSLREEWTLNSQNYLAGSVLSIPIDSLLNGRVELKMIFQPTTKIFFDSLIAGKDYLLLKTLENVQGKLLRASLNHHQWDISKVDMADHMTIALHTSSFYENLFFIGYESFLKSETISKLNADSSQLKLEDLHHEPILFNTNELKVEQRWSVSRDGTQIPYYFISSKTKKGPYPTLLYGYGGFEISETPYFSNVIGKSWLERGGAYALANIRGGGEFGPAWHQAAIKENRQKAFDDFISISEDLILKGATTPSQLAIMGGSNGGLLVSAVVTQRPELFGAVVSQVPLTDMLRYHKLLAGASWMGEYGDPEDPKMREVLLKYSPYHNVTSSQKYPPLFYESSTKDDRVHPGHARKMVARLEEAGHDVLYYENTEGGHSAAANLEQKIKLNSLTFTFLIKNLMK